MEGFKKLCSFANCMYNKITLLIFFSFLLVFRTEIIAQPCSGGSGSAALPTKCFEIESILVDACDGNNEGANEMVRLRVGPAPLTVNTLSVANYQSGNVNWGNGAPQNPFLGWASVNSTINTKVTTINNSIKAKGNCGVLIPVGSGGTVPAGANLLIITSTSFNPTAQDFSNVQDTLYVLFQVSGNTSGHFANYGSPSDTRRLILTYGTCRDTVIYDKVLLLKQDQTPGAEDGGTVLYTYSGTPTYVNYGCAVPITPITIDAGSVSGTICSGSVVPLNGTYSGNNCYYWYPENRNSGTFADSTNKLTTFTVSSGFTGTCKLYFRASVNCGTIRDSVSFTVNTSGVNLDISTTDSVACNKKPFALNASSNSSNALTWTTTGKGALSATNSLAVSYSPATADTSFVWFKLVQSASCGIPADSIRVRFAPVASANFNPASLIVCKGSSPIALNPVSSGGLFGGNSNISGNTFNPLDTGLFLVYYKTTALGCADSVAKSIRVLPIPDASFQRSDSLICKNGSFVDLVPKNSGGVWYGPNLIGNRFTPIDTGLFQFAYVIGNGTCKDSVVQTVRVLPAANPSFDLSDTVICSKTGKATMLPLFSGGVFSGIGVLGQEFKADTIGGLFSIKHLISLGSCKDSLQKTIRVIKRANPVFSASDTLVCNASGDITFSFNEAGGVLTGSGIVGGVFKPSSAGLFEVKYKINREICWDSSSVWIRVLDRQNPSFSPTDTVACEGDPLIGLNPLQSGGVFSGSTYITGTTFNPFKAGKYTIVYKLSNNACLDSSTQTIRVSPKPVANFTIQPIEPVIKDSVFIRYSGTGASSWQWEFGPQNPFTSSLQNPDVVFSKPGEYIIRLLVKNIDGCFDSISKVLNVADEATLFAPNVFTPNGDSINDRFLCLGTSIAEFRILIYNRWGGLIFESSDIKEAWDGNHKGQACPEGVYMFIVTATGTNQRNLSMHGTVTLIR